MESSGAASRNSHPAAPIRLVDDAIERPNSSTALLPPSSDNDSGTHAHPEHPRTALHPPSEHMSTSRRKNGSPPSMTDTPARPEGESSRSSADVEMEDIGSDDDDETLLADDEETGLTQPQRRKRTRLKTQHAGLDGHVSGRASIRSAPGSAGTTEEKLVATTLVKNILVNAVLIGLWYSFSISISVYNKWMFSGDNLDFHYPLFTTSMHMVVQFLLASSVLFFFPRFRPQNASPIDPHNPTSYSRLNNTDDPEDHTNSPEQPTTKQPLMTKFFYLTRIGPCGTATALDIGLGNFSLRFISLTFFTMCKSSVLGFVLLFAFIFRLEPPTWRLILIICFMTVGVIMMVAGEAAFNALGFVLVMLASFCSGFRWSLTQILLLRNRATSNPFSSIFFLTPVMFLALFILAIPIEGPANVIQGVKDLAASKGGFASFGLLLFPGILAFLMVSAEFALLKRTSVVTLSVCGIFKEVLTISAAGAIFGDELSPINVSGLVVTIASIAAYNYLKYTKLHREAAQEAHEAFVERRGDEQGDGEEIGKPAVVVGPEAIGETTGVKDDELPLLQDDSNLQDDEGHLEQDTGSHVDGTMSGKRPSNI